jgi:hypothetical protein
VSLATTLRLRVVVVTVLGTFGSILAKEVPDGDVVHAFGHFVTFGIRSEDAVGRVGSGFPGYGSIRWCRGGYRACGCFGGSRCGSDSSSRYWWSGDHDDGDKCCRRYYRGGWPSPRLDVVIVAIVGQRRVVHQVLCCGWWRLQKLSGSPFGGTLLGRRFCWRLDRLGQGLGRRLGGTGHCFNGAVGRASQRTPSDAAVED